MLGSEGLLSFSIYALTQLEKRGWPCDSVTPSWFPWNLMARTLLRQTSE
uniref:Uncharacterized protein n=1 Tax=Rhizophora mucronata TaxID=61149 RepID=A0A2P2QQH9_RHIMU